ncbi:hypothetical protein [Blastopirellula retiformator]|uniref:Lipoprotein n=1 Tax=Blastopirellula retiformator TaxID=2527970 RepID=A0A5C5VP28_9BACT|nr:hypothetical protein [Blastopirellula retiformator]TWT39733.1 hypothetical protein Enr8_14340 [Blastopirellula retiformator]
MSRLLISGLLFAVLAAAGGCGARGPQSSAELFAAYRTAQESGDPQQVHHLIAWVEEVRPDLNDPCEGGAPACQLTRQAITWALVRPAASGERTTLDIVQRPAEFGNATITPSPLYWVRVAHYRLADDQPKQRHCACITLPVVIADGEHHFFGSPYHEIETTFYAAGIVGGGRREEAPEIPSYPGEERLLVQLEPAR